MDEPQDLASENPVNFASRMPKNFTIEDDPEGRSHAIHILAHECAHVEVTNMFERCFPKVLLREHQGTILGNFQWKVIFAVWDEFAVTAISAGIGEDQTDAYEATFINDLKKAEALSNDLILAYREHGSMFALISEIVDDLVERAGLIVSNMENGQLWVDIPYTPDTTPPEV